MLHFSRLSSALLGLILISACQSDPSMPTSAETLKTAACEPSPTCTREHIPTLCEFQGQKFEGANPCEARREVKSFACKEGLVLQDSAIQCTPSNLAQAPAPKTTGNTSCKPSGMCTMEMNPQSCVYAGKQFQGNNRCEALRKVQTFACERGMALDDDAIKCVARAEVETSQH